MEQISLEKNDKGVTFRKSWEEKGVNYITSVEKVDGGYIITEEKYGTPEGEKEYLSECIKKVSTENPFEKSEEDTMFSFVKKAFID